MPELRHTHPCQQQRDGLGGAQCGQGMALDVQKGLTPLQVYYAEGILPNSRGKPYWVTEGQVNLQRDVYRSSGKRAQEAVQFGEVLCVVA